MLLLSLESHHRLFRRRLTIEVSLYFVYVIALQKAILYLITGVYRYPTLIMLIRSGLGVPLSVLDTQGMYLMTCYSVVEMLRTFPAFLFVRIFCPTLLTGRFSQKLHFFLKKIKKTFRQKKTTPLISQKSCLKIRIIFEQKSLNFFINCIYIKN